MGTYLCDGHVRTYVRAHHVGDGHVRTYITVRTSLYVRTSLCHMLRTVLPPLFFTVTFPSVFRHWWLGDR